MVPSLSHPQFGSKSFCNAAFSQDPQAPKLQQALSELYPQDTVAFVVKKLYAGTHSPDLPSFTPTPRSRTPHYVIDVFSTLDAQKETLRRLEYGPRKPTTKRRGCVVMQPDELETLCQPENRNQLAARVGFYVDSLC